MKKILVQLTPELLRAIDAARGSQPRNPWLEKHLWRLKVIRDGAADAGVQRPDRPDDGRGGNRQATFTTQ